uniref:Uncharacterized protein n=1 Tax=Tetranychus urticae TaxID=32264 RepID=T1JT08_TETUR
MIKMFEAEISCNDTCFTEEHCISSDGSGVCSDNNLVTAQFKVIPFFGTYDYLQLTLKSYNVTSDDEKTIKVSIEQPGYLGINYTCYKSSNGPTDASFDRGSYSLTTGSSSYMKGVLSCNWNFIINDGFWPERVARVRDSSLSITLYDDSKGVLVAQDTSRFPSYHAQYLKSCDKVHGNDEWNVLDVYITNGTKLMYFPKQITGTPVIQGEICSWATPFVLGDSRISIDASTTNLSPQMWQKVYMTDAIPNQVKSH